MKRLGRWVMWTALLATIGIAAYLSLLPQPLEVEWATIAEGPMDVAIEEDGVTRVKDRYAVSSNVGGQLLRIKLKSGDEIKQNQTLLATIQPSDPSMLDARQVSQAKAAVAAAKVAVERGAARKGQAKAALDLAESQFGRSKQLLETKSISREEHDVAVATFRAREEELHVANFEQEIAQFELQQAEAALVHFTSSDGSSLENFEIRSPIDGRVLRVFQESAMVVSPGTPLLEVGNPKDLEIVVDVLSRDAVKIKPGDDVVLEQWGGDRPLRGVVRVVEPAAFTRISALGVEEQRVNVVSDFSESSEDLARLGDGYRVESRIIVWQSEKALKVPTSALFRESGEWHAFKIVENKAKKVKLEIGERNATDAELITGLAVGDQVIVYPNDMTHDGADLVLKGIK